MREKKINSEFIFCCIIQLLLANMDDSYSHFNNNKVRYLHERCLRLICSGKTFSYEEQLEKCGSVSIHHKNIQTLAF